MFILLKWSCNASYITLIAGNCNRAGSFELHDKLKNSMGRMGGTSMWLHLTHLILGWEII